MAPGAPPRQMAPKAPPRQMSPRQCREMAPKAPSSCSWQSVDASEPPPKKLRPAEPEELRTMFLKHPELQPWSRSWQSPYATCPPPKAAPKEMKMKMRAAAARAALALVEQQVHPQAPEQQIHPLQTFNSRPEHQSQVPPHNAQARKPYQNIGENLPTRRTIPKHRRKSNLPSENTRTRHRMFPSSTFQTATALPAHMQTTALWTPRLLLALPRPKPSMAPTPLLCHIEADFDMSDSP